MVSESNPTVLNKVKHGEKMQAGHVDEKTLI
jgi:hypothetical protein